MDTEEKAYHLLNKYICKYCAKVFSQRSAHLRHSLTHTGAKPYQQSVGISVHSESISSVESVSIKQLK